MLSLQYTLTDEFAKERAKPGVGYTLTILYFFKENEMNYK